MNLKNKYDIIFSKKTAVYMAILGVLIFAISLFSSKQQTAESSAFSYETFLETRLEKIIKDAGIEDVSVMITTKAKDNEKPKQVDLFSASNKQETGYISEIAGVVIVSSSIKETSDFNIIKEAASTALDIPKNKIYIFGGAAKQ